METSVKYQYLQNLLGQAIDSSKDENFKRLMIALTQNYNTEYIYDLIYFCISCLSLPKFFHKYGFLLLQFKSSNIQELLEILDTKDKLEKTTKIFSEFTNKIDLWEKLEVSRYLNLFRMSMTLSWRELKRQRSFIQFTKV